MELRRDIRITIGALVSIHVLTSVCAIGLLVRMSPAIERILEENVYSLDAVEEMLAVLALPSDEEDPGARHQRLEDALERARGNITEDQERGTIAEIERELPLTLDGGPAARRSLVHELRRLGEINRDAMHRADEEAVRLGNAGAWAVVLLGLAGFLFGLLAVQRLRFAVAAPVAELLATLEAARRGESRRRCSVSGGSLELRRALEEVNELLDAGERRHVSSQRDAVVDRAVVNQFLDAREGAVVIVDHEGTIRAANRAALAALGGPDGVDLRARVTRAAERASDRAPEGWTAIAGLEGVWIAALA